MQDFAEELLRFFPTQLDRFRNLLNSIQRKEAAFLWGRPPTQLIATFADLTQLQAAWLAIFHVDGIHEAHSAGLAGDNQGLCAGTAAEETHPPH